ncbi:uncharacterized protein LOC144106818 [Amblyomma americanum]
MEPQLQPLVEWELKTERFAAPPSPSMYLNTEQQRIPKPVYSWFGVKAQQQALIIQPVFVGAYSIAIVHWQPGKAAGSHGTAAAASGGMGAENRTLRRATFAFDVPEYGAAEDSETCVFVVRSQGPAAGSHHPASLCWCILHCHRSLAAREGSWVTWNRSCSLWWNGS